MIRAIVDFALNSRFVVFEHGDSSVYLGHDLVPQPAG